MSAEVSTRQSAEKILDEDEWTECLEAIVQRDYFPNVPKLQNKLEWIEVFSHPASFKSNIVHATFESEAPV